MAVNVLRKLQRNIITNKHWSACKELAILVRVQYNVKQSRNRTGVAQRVPGGLGAQIYHDIRHMKVVRQSDLRTGRLYPQEMFLVLIFTRG